MIWQIKKYNGDYIILPKEKLYCPVCGGELLLHDITPYHQITKGFHHVDIHMKCINCGFYLTFGVAISEEDYKKLSGSKYVRRILKWELKNLYPEYNEELESRLKAWGYW